MPVLSSFYGILIYIYREINSKHHMPHFHAKFNEFEGVYDFEGNLIEGNLPKKKAKLVEAWCAIHEDELNASWTAWNESGELIKIEGLR
ncbi:DUF4160 domain-containing protein [Bengtsoniella intestinalis]|uniref:DUF4160 domain-containing protein n=1 Tax=Bengtsoniella intestinalis TaxID=3073143 RepID=UPI00391EFBAF